MGFTTYVTKWIELLGYGYNDKNFDKANNLFDSFFGKTNKQIENNKLKDKLSKSEIVEEAEVYKEKLVKKETYKKDININEHKIKTFKTDIKVLDTELKKIKSKEVEILTKTIEIKESEKIIEVKYNNLIGYKKTNYQKLIEIRDRKKDELNQDQIKIKKDDDEINVKLNSLNEDKKINDQKLIEIGSKKQTINEEKQVVTKKKEVLYKENTTAKKEIDDANINIREIDTPLFVKNEPLIKALIKMNLPQIEKEAGNLYHGNKNEGVFIKKYFKDNYKEQPYLSNKIMTGKADVIKEDIVYELKFKVSGVKRCYKCFDNYYLQVQLYLLMANLETGVCIVYHKDEYRECVIEKNPKFIRGILKSMINIRKSIMDKKQVRIETLYEHSDPPNNHFGPVQTF